MQVYDKFITSLAKDEVFVFTSNKKGFSGAGSAGMASFGTPKNVWRERGYANLKHGTKMLWNVKGVAEGFMRGTHGKSYAIPTVTEPGRKCSISLGDIKLSICSLYAFALAEPQLKFFVAQTDKMGYSGRTPEEMCECWTCMEIPNNIYFYRPFYNIILKKINHR